MYIVIGPGADSESLVRICVQHNVVALRGEEARKAYFDNKSLSFTEGYKVLMGGVSPPYVLIHNEF